MVYQIIGVTLERTQESQENTCYGTKIDKVLCYKEKQG